MKFPVQFHMVPTCREPDGLAMSSRNQRLNPEQREKAAVIWQTLQYIKEHLKAGDPAPVLETAHHKLDAAGFKTDYVALGRVSDLQPVETWNGKDKIIALIAAYQGEVRLIDNLLLN
jgi:pantoate--beta-alanine ligase